MGFSLFISFVIGAFSSSFISSYINVKDVKLIHNALEHINCHSTILPPMIIKYLPKECISWIETAKFYGEQIYIRIEQFLKKNCIQITKNVYQVSYVIDNKLYKILVSPTRGPRDLNDIEIITGINIKDSKDLEDLNDLKDLDFNDTDITNNIIPFMNGYKSLTKITPKKLGYSLRMFKKKFSSGETENDFNNDELKIY